MVGNGRLKCKVKNKHVKIIFKQKISDANRRLHDTNDNLRGALEQRSVALRQMNTVKFDHFNW